MYEKLKAFFSFIACLLLMLMLRNVIDTQDRKHDYASFKPFDRFHP